MESTGYVFPLHEENGEAYFMFEATNSSMAISIQDMQNTNWPTHYTLFYNSCAPQDITETGTYEVDEFEISQYRFTGLDIGSVYIFGFSGATSYFELEVALNKTESSGPINNCNITTDCNLVPNPGIDEFDALINLPVGGDVFGMNHPTAYINEACDWDLASTHNQNTPDYYRDTLNLAFVNFPIFPGTATNCTAIANAQGNVCPGVSHNNSLGVMRILSTRTDIVAQRREYAFTRLEQSLQTNHIYYISTWARHDLDRDTRSRAYQILFPENSLTGPANFPVSQGGLITTLGTPQVDLNTIDLNDPDWQQQQKIFSYQGNTPSDVLVIGNFLDNAATNLLTTNGHNANSPNTNLDTRPAAFFDDFEVIELANAGNDIDLCDITPVTIGNPAPCIDPNTIIYSWTNVATGQVIGNTVPLTVTPEEGTNLYTLTQNYMGLIFENTVAVNVAPELTATGVNSLNCTGVIQYLINDIELSQPWSITSNDVTWTTTGANQPTIDPSGLLTLNGVQILNGGTGTITLNGFSTAGGIHCPKTLTFNVYECCNNAKPVNYHFQPGDNMTSQFGNQLIITGANIVITGNVFANNLYVFRDCNFFFSADSRLEIPSGFSANMTGRCTLQPCGEWRWDGVLVNDNATLAMTGAEMWGAIRGVEVLDNGSFFANSSYYHNNYNHVLFNAHNTGTHDIYSCDFISEPFGFGGIVQTTNSTVQLATHPAPFITGIVALNSNDVTIGNPSQGVNRFSTTSPSANDIVNECIYIYTDNSEFSMYNNRVGFAKTGVYAINTSNYQIGGLSNGEPNFFNPAFSSYNPFSGIGIHTKNSTGTIEKNNFTELGVAISLENCPPNAAGLGDNFIHENAINARTGVDVARTNQGAGRVRINANAITNANYGVKATNYSGDAPDVIYINYNNIETVAPQGLNDPSFGIYLQENGGFKVGDNSLSTVNNYIPNNPISYPNVAGIYVKECQGAEISNNIVTEYDHGLVLDNAGSTYYSCITFNDCRTGVLYQNINTPFVQAVRNYSTGIQSSRSNVVFNDANIPNAVLGRVRAVNCNTSGAWYFDNNFNGPEDPSLGNLTGYPLIFGSPLLGSSFGCNIPLPSFKTQGNYDDFKFNYKVYPNPSNDYLTIEVNSISTYRIVNTMGVELIANTVAEGQTTIATPKDDGVYFIYISNNNKNYVEKIIVNHSN